jgi:hypothetical protein
MISTLPAEGSYVTIGLINGWRVVVPDGGG